MKQDIPTLPMPMNKQQKFEHLKSEFVSRSERFIDAVKVMDIEQLYDAENKFKIAALRNNAVKSYVSMLEFILELNR